MIQTTWSYVAGPVARQPHGAVAPARLAADAGWPAVEPAHATSPPRSAAGGVGNGRTPAVCRISGW